MPRLPETFWLLCTLAAVAVGCKPKVGDDCNISTDCSAAGDRLCDITAPGGYCTVFNCEPGTCPVDESLCVEFGAQRSTVAKQCIDRQSPSPYARAFCMATCKHNSDCRAGYTCQDLSSETNDWAAVLIDRDRGNRACVVPLSTDESPGAGGAFGDVCLSVLPPARVEEAASSGGAPGQGGAGG
jgi:hypothetical protein